VELTSVDRKFVYHIANIFFKVIKVLISFILFSSWVHVQKTQLQGQHLNVKDVIDKVDLDNILNQNCGKENSKIFVLL
jgi:hypothetical protein